MALLQFLFFVLLFFRILSQYNVYLLPSSSYNKELHLDIDSNINIGHYFLSPYYSDITDY